MEDKVAQTLLEEPTTIIIGGEAYKVAPPSIITLVRASKYISKIPADTIDYDHIFGSIVHKAEDYENIAWAVAVIILGNRFTEVARPPFWQFWKQKKEYHPRGGISYKTSPKALCQNSLKPFLRH